ncbi:MAG: hypothetical protein PV354_10225 [Bartonella sp.]|nr:hypothetical protein [Bartonella sp.]
MREKDSGRFKSMCQDVKREAGRGSFSDEQSAFDGMMRREGKYPGHFKYKGSLIKKAAHVVQLL